MEDTLPTTQLMEAATPFLVSFVTVIGSIAVAFLSSKQNKDKEEKEAETEGVTATKEKTNQVEYVDRDLFSSYVAAYEKRLDAMQEQLLQSLFKNKQLTEQNAVLLAENATLRNQVLVQGLRIDAVEKHLAGKSNLPTR